MTHEVKIGELARILGVAPSTIHRQIDAGEFPEADRRTGGATKGYGHRRWKVATAVRILEERSAKVPRPWADAAARSAKGGAA